MKKKIIWWAINGGILISMYFSAFASTPIAGLENIVIFYVWFSFIISLFGMSDDFLKEARKKKIKRSVSIEVSFTFDIIMIIAFVYSGWIICSVLNIISLFLSETMWGNVGEFEKKDSDIGTIG